MFALFNLKLSDLRQPRHANPKRRLLRNLDVEPLARRDLLAADLMSGLYDDSQVLGVESAEKQPATNDLVVQVNGNDAIESAAIHDAIAGQPVVNDSAQSVNLLACIGVHEMNGLMASSAGDRWAFGGIGMDGFRTAVENHLSNGPAGDTGLDSASSYSPLEHMGGASLRGKDVDDVMVGGIDGDDFRGSFFDSAHRGLRVHSLSTEDHADLVFESDRIESIDADDPDLIDGLDASEEALPGSDDDLELIALAGAGGGYGGYGGETPEISDFVGVASPNDMWTFSGTVWDNDDPTGLTVTLSGLIDATTTVVGNDNFSVGVEVPAGSFGWVGVTVTDDDDNTSAVAWFLVDDGP